MSRTGRQIKFKEGRKQQRKATFPSCFFGLLLFILASIWWLMLGLQGTMERWSFSMAANNSYISDSKTLRFGGLSREQVLAAPLPRKQPLGQDAKKKQQEDALASVLLHRDNILMMPRKAPKPELANSQGLDGKQKRAGFAVTVTADGSGVYTDGAAVLAYGVRKACRKSKYQVDLVAFVHPNATVSQGRLAKLGFKIFVRDVPIKNEEIQNEWLRDRIKRGGCCGDLELLKLWGYTLEEYDRILLLDMDSMVLQCPDDLFDRKELGLYTHDYGMMEKGTKKYAVQGGFILIKPDKTVFEEYMQIYRIGNYKDGVGWGASEIGHFWGGLTIQGVVSYYYNYLHQGSGAEINRCVYNNMADNPECLNTPVHDIKNFHFTVCQKPWDCVGGMNGLCSTMHMHWISLRHELESELGQKLTNPCPKPGEGSYIPMNLARLGVAKR